MTHSIPLAIHTTCVDKIWSQTWTLKHVANMALGITLHAGPSARVGLCTVIGPVARWYIRYGGDGTGIRSHL